jgi:hypothetical protein
VVSRQKSLNFPPGHEYSYSNTGYNLSAVLVSRVSGESFAQFSKKYIFEPLGMTHTEWRDDYTRVVKRRAIAYSPTREKGWRMNMPFENVHGNGGLLTTVEDMLKWNENFVHARLGGRQFVDMQLRRGRLNDGTEIEYAAGLNVSSWRGVKEIRHSGSTAGYRAFLARYPDHGLSVAVACNASNAGASSLAHQVAELYLGDELSPETKPPPPITLHAEVLEARAGVYRHDRTGAALRLIMDEGELRLEGGPELVPVSATSFRLGDRDTRFEFDLDAGGKVVAVRRGDARRYTRERAATPDAKALSAYAGRYRSEEAEAEFVASVEEAELVLRRRPDAVFELKPTWADAFIAPFGTIVFRRGAGGRIEGMSLIVSRMYDLRFARVDEN